MGSKVKLTLLCLLAVGVLDHLYATQSSADSTVRRLGLHQDKSQAYWLYFFIAHIYDGILVRACRCQPVKPREAPRCHRLLAILTLSPNIAWRRWRRDHRTRGIGPRTCGTRRSYTPT